MQHNCGAAKNKFSKNQMFHIKKNSIGWKRPRKKSIAQKAKQLTPISFHSCLYALQFNVYFGHLSRLSTALIKKFQSLPVSECFHRLSSSVTDRQSIFSSTWWKCVSCFAALRRFCQSETSLPDQYYMQTLMSIFILEANAQPQKI